MRAALSPLAAALVGLIACASAAGGGGDDGAPPPEPAVGALMVQGMCHPAVALSVWNMRRRLPGVPIQIFYSAESERSLRAWFGGGANASSSSSSSLLFGDGDGGRGGDITLTPMPGRYFDVLRSDDPAAAAARAVPNDHPYNSLSRLFTDAAFWDLVRGRKVLTFQQVSA